jgi:hypothetical protein
MVLHTPAEPQVFGIELHREAVQQHSNIGYGIITTVIRVGDHTYYHNGAKCLIGSPEADPPWVVGVTLTSVLLTALDNIPPTLWKAAGYGAIPAEAVKLFQAANPGTVPTTRVTVLSWASPYGTYVKDPNRYASHHLYPPGA